MYGSAHTRPVTGHIFLSMEMKTRLGGRQQWGDLTDDELIQAASKRDALFGLVQTKFGIAQEEAEQQVKDREKIHEAEDWK